MAGSPPANCADSLTSNAQPFRRSAAQPLDRPSFLMAATSRAQS
jgi:hypothetical protein